MKFIHCTLTRQILKIAKPLLAAKFSIQLEHNLYTVTVLDLNFLDGRKYASERALNVQNVVNTEYSFLHFNHVTLKVNAK